MGNKLYAIAKPDGTVIVQVEGTRLCHFGGRTIICNDMVADYDSAASVPAESGCIVYEVQDRGEDEKRKGE